VDVVGVQQGVERGWWVQQQPSDRGLGDEQDSVTRGDGARPADADRQTEMAVDADMGRTVGVRDGK
jgi:hypothetical protein